jgi:isoquinoline 1-oxidoreductase alpha subunit
MPYVVGYNLSNVNLRSVEQGNRAHREPHMAARSRQNMRGAIPRTRKPLAKEGRMTAVTFTINGKAVSVEAEADTALLWVVREHLKLTGTKYGCGSGLCGACTVHVDGKPVRSCQIGVSKVKDRKVTTIEGLSPNGRHPLQKAWVAEQVPQCGYCQSGQIMQAAALLASNKKPTRTQIVEHMDGNICRCGTYPRIVRAIQRAAREG